jgi:hypothetical protein
MSGIAHKIFIFTLTIIVIGTFIALCYLGISYYRTSVEERFFHSAHNFLKPSGIIGHGLGIAGTLLMILGISSYMARKRFRILSRMGLLKYWLEFHIFLCTLGPIMILFHTSFKFGGIVSISFWSMVAVFLSGIVGRFIYIQIPRTIEGRELNLNEVRDMKTEIGEILKTSYKLDEGSLQTILSVIHTKPVANNNNSFFQFIKRYCIDSTAIKQVKTVLKKNKVPTADYKKVIALVKKDLSLNRKIERLVTMQKLFTYWHVAHLPFALVMLIIMVIHVAVTIAFGYKWIF